MVKRPMKYNPAFLSDEELIDAFVVRQTELDLLLQVLRENTAESNQHVLLIGPRGIGKTMLVLRVAAETRRADDLRERWYPLVFAEESYQACTAGEFWLEALFHLAEQTKDARWRRAYEELRGEEDEARLRERALAQLMDFADAQGKRILLIVENLNMLLGDQLSDDDAWALRHTLLHEPRVMLLATAASRFAEIENAGMAMFDLFRVHELHPLEEDDCARIWASIAEKGVPDGRIRPIQILTGGNPRLLAIISYFGADMSFRELMTDLVHLVDEHTEYFKSHLDGLPAVERKVYVALVELWDPATAREVADSARLDVSKTSTLLSRLAGRGAVLAVEEGPRKKRYQVAERMYNIYYLMRRRGSPAARVKAVVHFMVSLYGPGELVGLARGIAEEASRLPPDLRQDHYSAFEAMLQDPGVRPLRDRLLAAAPCGFLEAPDAPPSLKHLAREATATSLPAAEPAAEDGGFEALLQQAFKLAKDPDRVAEAEELCRRAIDLRPDSPRAHVLLGLLCEKLGCYADAEEAYRKAIDLDPKYAWAWARLGALLHERLERYHEAEKAYRKAIELNPKYGGAWAHLGVLLHDRLERYEEAEKAYRKAIDLEPKYAWAWAHLGALLHERLERYDEAEKAYRKAIELDPKFAGAWAHLGALLHEHLERYDEAEKAYRKAIELDPKYAGAWAHLGQLLHQRLERYGEAEKAYRKAVDLEPKVAWGWASLGELLHERLERYDEAEKACRKAIELDPKYAGAWGRLIAVLASQGTTPGECLKLIEGGLAESSDRAAALNNGAYGLLRRPRADLLACAESWARRSVGLAPDNAHYQHTLSSVLSVVGKCDEALGAARRYLGDAECVNRTTEDAVDLFANLAAAGSGREALRVLVESPSAEVLEPLIVGLRLFLGEDVKVAAEILEVGKDVAKRIEQRREGLRAERDEEERGADE